MNIKFLNKHLLAFMAVMLLGNVYSQSQVSGSVSDSDSMAGIPGVNVIIEGTSVGTVTDFDGNFVLNSNQAPPFNLVISYVGYSAQTVSVTSSGQDISISLSAGQNLEEVVISAGRKEQKVLEAPASISVISARTIENSPSVTDPVRLLSNTPGVQIQQQTANTLNVEMRAGSGVFGTSTFLIKDNRYMVTPSAGLFLSYQSGLSNLDLATVEVVRGPAGVLYGPGVTSGVVHFRTKSPIDYPGNSMSVWAGEMATLGTELRIARANDDKTFGWKINAKVSTGDDFVYDNEAAVTARTTMPFATEVRQPAISNMMVDPVGSLSSRVLLNTGDLDKDGDGNMLINDYSNLSFDAHMEWRPDDNATYKAAGGMNSGRGAFFNSQGVGYQQGTQYWAQAQANVGNWYAQVFYDYNDGGGDDNPTFLYATGLRQVAERSSLQAQLQYSFDMPWLFDSEWTVGWDYNDTMSDSAYTLYGRNDDNDDYVVNGFYGQGTLHMSEKMDLVVAGRYDAVSFISTGDFAPSATLVYKASPKSTWRLGFKETLTTNSALTQYIDFPVAALAPGILDVWLAGQEQSHRFGDPSTQMIELAGLGVSIPSSAAAGGLPLAIPYGSVAAASLAGLYAQAPSLQPLLTPFFATYQGPSGGSGTLSPYNLFNGLPMPSSDDTRGAQFGSVSNFELGWTGVIGDKLKISADIYTYENRGFTYFQAVGQTFALVGSDIPNDLAAAVMSDITPYVTNVLTGVTTAQYAALGLPATGVPALGIPSLAQAIAGGVAQTVGGVGGAFNAGGQGFVALAGPLFAALGAVESSAVPQGDGVTHIPAGYRTYGDATRSHWGADMSMDYFVNSDVRLWANASWLSQNEWIPGEDDDDDLPYYSSLNAPKFKWRVGMDYTPPTGLNLALSFQHDDKFYTEQGFFTGMVDTKNLIDLNIGYKFSPAMRFDISAQNLTDDPYSAFPNMPTIKRRVLGKLTFNF
ncbi:MAG: TonB-dependent receptor domain-containing protein [Candidatus Marisimplicoccus sp.]